MEVSGIDKQVVQISAGYYHSCAVTGINHLKNSYFVTSVCTVEARKGCCSFVFVRNDATVPLMLSMSYCMLSSCLYIVE